MPSCPRSPDRFAETARNLVWVGLIYGLSAASGERQHGVRLVYGAVAAVLGFQLVVTSLHYFIPVGAIEDTAVLLRITAAAGLLVLVHNLYGQASPGSRSSIRLAMLALSLTWSYDLNLYTIAYLDSRLAPDLIDGRGFVVAATAPMFALAANREGWKIRLSRAATFQSLSLLAICAYFAVMAIRDRSSRNERGMVAQPPRGPARSDDRGGHGSAPELEGAQLGQGEDHQASVRAPLRLPDRMAALTSTVGITGAMAPLGELVIKAFADILEAPGGLLLSRDPPEPSPRHLRGTGLASTRPRTCSTRCGSSGPVLESNGRIIELDGLRNGWASPADCVSLLPQNGCSRSAAPGSECH